MSEITVSRVIDCDPEYIWELLTTPTGWNNWFCKGAKFEFELNGKYSNDDKDQGEFTDIRSFGHRRDSDEYAGFDMTWQNPDHCPGTSVVVSLAKDDKKRFWVHVTHKGLENAKACEDMREGWNEVLDTLKLVAETG